jgi:hypothetical protein
LVTLEKETYSYRDGFDGTLFWWQSQNRQTQQTPIIRSMVAGRIPVLLFARVRAKTAGRATPFVYCGRLTTPDVEGDKPVTALFGLSNFVQHPVGELLGVYRWRPNDAPAATEQERHQTITYRRTQGQGRQLDAKLRRAIELHAMRIAAEHYTSEGWSVTDTSASRPFDLECRKGDEVRRVEVKGTQSAGDTILVTDGEVRSACEVNTTTDLFIVHSIAIMDCGSDRMPTGGEARLVAGWVPLAADLTPTAYTCRVK